MALNKKNLRYPPAKVGDKHTTKNSGECIITRVDGYGTSHNTVEVMFTHTGHTKTCRVSELRKGTVRDPYYPQVFGIGYLGEGEYKGNHVADAYNVWYAMMTRCYSKSHRYSTYDDVTVDPRWHNFQVFAKWYYKHFRKGYHLDKDVIGDTRVYGPDTCAYIPAVLNGIEARLRGALIDCPELQEVYDLFVYKVKERFIPESLVGS